MNLIFQFGEFSSESGTDWASFFASFFSALLGAGIALFVYRDGVETQKAKELMAQKSAEKSKVKYLYFLIEDSLSSLQIIVDGIDKTILDHQRMPLVMPTLTFKPPTSLIRIANKINQEDYFHASLSQVVNSNVSEIFIQFDFLGDLYNEFNALIPKYGGEVTASLQDLRFQQRTILVDTKNLIRNLPKYNLSTQARDNLQKSLNSTLINFEQAMEQQHPEMYHKIPDMVFIPIRESIKQYDHIEDIAGVLDKIQAFINSQFFIISDVESKIAYYSHIRKIMIISMNKIIMEKGAFDEYIKKKSFQSHPK